MRIFKRPVPSEGDFAVTTWMRETGRVEQIEGESAWVQPGTYANGRWMPYDELREVPLAKLSRIDPPKR